METEPAGLSDYGWEGFNGQLLYILTRNLECDREPRDIYNK